MAIPMQVSFDADDPPRLARFWALALDYVLQPPPDGHDSWADWASANEIPQEALGDYGAVIDPSGRGPRLLFQKVPEGKTAKNRVHVDVNVSAGIDDREERARTVDAHVERLVAEGGTLVADKDERGERWVVMQDPEGNEFCVQ